MAHRPFTYTIRRLWHTDPLPTRRLWHTDPLHIQLEDYGTPTLYIYNWKIMAHRPFT